MGRNGKLRAGLGLVLMIVGLAWFQSVGRALYFVGAILLLIEIRRWRRRAIQRSMHSPAAVNPHSLPEGDKVPKDPTRT